MAIEKDERPQIGGQKFTVLCFSRNREHREQIIKNLSRTHFPYRDMLQTDNVGGALSLVRAKRPDLVIANALPREECGLDHEVTSLLKEIKTNGELKHIPVAVWTSDQEAETDYFYDGADAVIPNFRGGEDMYIELSHMVGYKTHFDLRREEQLAEQTAAVKKAQRKVMTWGELLMLLTILAPVIAAVFLGRISDRTILVPVLGGLVIAGIGHYGAFTYDRARPLTWNKRRALWWIIGSCLAILALGFSLIWTTK